MSKDPVITEIERAITLQNQGNIADAVKIARWVLTQAPRHPAAIHAATIWAKAEGSNPEALYALSSSYLLQGQFDRAIQGLKIVIQMKPDHAAAYSALAVCLNKTGDLANAMAMAEKSLELDPDDLNAHINIVDTLHSMGEFEKGLTYAKGIEKKFPKNATLMMLFGRLYEAMGDIKNALSYNRKAIQLQPDTPTFRAASLSTAMTSGDEKLILEELKPAFETFSRHTHFQSLMQQIWDVIRTMQVLVDKKPLDPSGRILQARDMQNYTSEHLQLIDKTRPIWTFQLKDMRCYTTDFMLYDDHDIFMNLQVTGVPFRFLMSAGLHHSAYIDERFPVSTIEEPGFLLGGVDNYYHWLNDYLPRLAALEAHPEYQSRPIYINENVAPFQLQSLAALGIDPSRIRHYPQHQIVTFKDMILPFLSGRPMKPSGEPDKMKPNENPFITQWLRDKFVKPSSNKRKRYFISRAEAKFRRCLNEDEIFAIAQEYGFEKLVNEGKSFTEQIETYQDAEAIMGPHGAGFTNMIFAPKDAAIIEFFPKNRKPKFYEALARQNGQKYLTLEGPIMRTFPNLTPDFGDFLLNVEEFRELMRKNF